MINVTCAIIRNEENEVLVVQRGEATDHPFKWEFPGGKLDEGETLEECVIREIKEELSMTIVICGRLQDVEHDYGHKQIRLIPFVCDTLDEIPFLTEHLAYKWVSPADLLNIDFSEADVFVAENYLAGHKPENRLNARAVEISEEDSLYKKDIQSILNNMMSTRDAEWIASSASEIPAITRRLFEFSSSPDKRIAFRASWIISKVYDSNPDVIDPFIPDIIENLPSLENESTIRSFLRIISMSEIGKISEHNHGILAEFCFKQLSSGFSAIAVKAYSMEILYRLALIYPELANELSVSINILMETGSAGIKSRGRQTLKKLAEIPIRKESSRK